MREKGGKWVPGREERRGGEGRGWEEREGERERAEEREGREDRRKEVFQRSRDMVLTSSNVSQALLRLAMYS